MKYEGKLYGRVGYKYIPLKMDSHDVDEMERDQKRLDWILSADDDELNSLKYWDRDSIDVAISVDAAMKGGAA